MQRLVRGLLAPGTAETIVGVLRDEVSIAPNGGYGFGPRHLDFHPSKPWIYVSLERQTALNTGITDFGVLTPQELGEAERGGIEWHALFTVGLFLFLISLAINFLAQRVVKRFKISIG